MLIWIGFLVLVAALLALDLGVFNKDAHTISAKEAFRWTGVWVSFSLLFSIFIYFAYENHWVHENGAPYSGQKAVITYLTGYLVEQSLSIDNIFVIAVIFAYFRIPQKYQHRVLFWGIIGAVLFRGIMIVIGAALLHRFSWVTYIFGGILLYTAYRMLRQGSHDEEVEVDKNPLVALAKRFFPVTDRFHDQKFFVKVGGVTAATPLFIALLVVETTDVLFAFDSIPAIFAITTDPFLVFTSNIFAILGLRSLYFVLASMLDKFQYLRYSLVVILAFVGIKMFLVHYIDLPEWLSLAVIALSLAGGILPSLPEVLRQRREEAKNSIREVQTEKAE
ncbi:TerC family protein [Haliscomenobacter sp.]|uniref:TerC family protein n=1 Tax=Haliscomenobacter sp. TaxID=2717303 RepID=UPI0035933D35